MALMALTFAQSSMAKDITIYVQADNQPNIHYWGNGITSSTWPGEKLTETTTVKNLEGTDMTFYYKTFTGLADDGAVSFVFNYDGDADKTDDISGVTEDQYYIYKGNKEYEDITAQFKTVSEATISKVQLPGSFNGWSGDANTFEAGAEANTFTGVVDFSTVTDEAVTFKLLVNNSSWLGWGNVTISAPDGWVQEAASDGNIQLNLSAIGAKQFTFTATWAGGTSASSGWTLAIDAEADAIISSVKLPGSYCGWDGDQALFTLASEKSYTYALDLSTITDDSVTFKLLVNGVHWLGYYDLAGIDAADGLLQEAASDGNIQLNLSAADTSKFIVTATWAGGKNGSAGWTLKVVEETPTGITAPTATMQQGALYDLQGRLLNAQQSSLRKGLYIVNGRVVAK